MKTLKEKYQARRERKTEKAFQIWKQSQSRSAVKTGMRSAFFWGLLMTLYKTLERYYWDDRFSWNELKSDFILHSIGGLFVGAAIAWGINRKFRKKMQEETGNQAFTE